MAENTNKIDRLLIKINIVYADHSKVKFFLIKNKNVPGILTSGRENIIFNIMRPIEHGQHDGRGDPSAILHMSEIGLNNRQRALLDNLPKESDEAVAKKGDVSMADLSALTAFTGAEFAMFTKGQDRLIVRGSNKGIAISGGDNRLVELSANGYKWSGHTHPGLNLTPSGADIDALNKFDQDTSVIYNAKGEYQRFYKKPERRQ